MGAAQQPLTGQDKNVLVGREAAVGIITFNRPHVLNALSGALMADLDQALTAMEEDSELRAIVITGAGDRAFSAGADIHEMAQLSEEENLRRQEQRWEHCWHLATCRKPTIGALNGLAYGGGALIASALDIRIGCPQSRFRFLAASYGRVNATWTLPHIVGLPMAKELLYSGRVVEAEEAHHIGLLNRLVPEERVLADSVALASAIADNDPRMVQGIKELLHSAIGLPWRQQLDNEWRALRSNLRGVPVREGFKEFLERKGRGTGEGRR